MAAPAGAGDAPKRLVLKLARTGGDQWAVSPGAAPPAASPAAASAAPEVKSEPKEEKNGRLIIRLKAPPQRKAAESDSEGEGDGARRSADGGPEAKRQRKPSAIALAAGGALSGAPRTSQREPKAPARQDDTSSHRDDEEDDEIEVSSMSHGGGGDKNRPQSTVMIPLRKAMSSLVAHLIKKDFYGIFYEPVDPEEVHDYYEVIKKPMCFKTIRKKLADDLYVESTECVFLYGKVCPVATVYVLYVLHVFMSFVSMCVLARILAYQLADTLHSSPWKRTWI